MEKLALIGYGALGRQIETLITQSAPPTSIVYFDDERHRSGDPGAFPFASYICDEFADYEFYVCLGYKHLALKRQILEKLASLGRRAPSFIHPRSFVDPSARVEAGAVVYAGCTIDQRATIGRGALLNVGVVVAHDATIGEACWLSPGVTISGNAVVGAASFLGSSATVSNDVQIGANATIGLATAVTKAVTAGTSVIGNPMRVLAHRLELI